jgi:hypothetical protein
MRQLARRIQRLEYTGTFVDVHRSFNRLVHEAALEVDLPPVCHQQLAAAIDTQLHALGQILPAFLMNERQIDAMVRQVCQAVRSVVDTVVDEAMRRRLLAALSEGCRQEARRRGRSETNCCTYRCKSCRRNSPCGAVVISGSPRGDLRTGSPDVKA